MEERSKVEYSKFYSRRLVHTIYGRRARFFWTLLRQVSGNSKEWEREQSWEGKFTTNYMHFRVIKNDFFPMALL